ncbi:dihydrodipicolinate synthase family protein [Roseovarius sp.]|uniref:dihydrodipicolinate synthase family protein n=1 Tax=Roseovarius sp. TaxID=1486281 RepID=UPI003563A8F3
MPEIQQPDIGALTGIHAATVCPLSSNGAIEETELQAHVAEISAAEGIGGLLVNGHAGEGHLLSPDERHLVIGVARAAMPADGFLTAGITSESTRSAVNEATAAAHAGADAVLVFPPNHWGLGLDKTIVIEHHRAIAEACGLPLLLYKAPLAWGRMSYDIDLLSDLCALDAVAGIKEGAWEVSAYEELRRRIKSERPGVSVMASGDEHLMACYQVGTDGSQVSLAAIVPELVAALFDASKSGDWQSARAIHDQIYPLSREIYRRAPAFLATARLKTCLKLLGKISSDRVKRPMRQLADPEVGRLQDVLSLYQQRNI